MTVMAVNSASRYNDPATRLALIRSLLREGETPRLFRRLSTIPEDEDAMLSTESDES